MPAAPCSRRSSRLRSVGPRAPASPIRCSASPATRRCGGCSAARSTPWATAPARPSARQAKRWLRRSTLPMRGSRSTSARKALFTKEGLPRKLGNNAAVSAAVAALVELEQQAVQQDAHDDHQRMVRLEPAAARLLACVEARARPDGHARPRARCAGVAGRPGHLGLGAAAPGRAAAPRPDRRVPGHQQPAVAGAAKLARPRMPARGAAPAASSRCRCSSSAIRSRASIAFGAPSRACSAAARRFVVEGLAGHDLACNHTRRNAPAVVDAVNAVLGRAVADGDYEGFIAHSTQRVGETAGEVRHLSDPRARAQGRQRRRRTPGATR